MFSRVDETTSRSLDGSFELRTVDGKVELWRRVDTLEAPTVDQLQTAILRASRKGRATAAPPLAVL